MVDILCRDTVTTMVIPYSIHTTEDSRILFIENFLAYMSWCPVFIQVLAVQIVVVITGSRHDVSQSVRDRNQLIALLDHFTRFGISIIPCTHDDVFALHRRFTIGMSQGTPNTGLLAETFHIADVTVGKFTELFYDLRVFVAILIGTDVYTLATEHRFFAFQIFLEQAVHEFISLWVEEVEVVHTVFLASDFRHIVREGEGMSRSVDFRNDFYEYIFGQLLQVDEFLLGIETVAGSQARISVRFETESSIGLVPIVFEELLESVIVQVDLEAVHLVIRHNLHIVAEIMHRDELTAAVNHESTDAIIREVTDFALRKGQSLFCHLKESTGSPVNTYRFRSR